MSLGILVCGDNHLILGGPLPGPECARRLARHFGLSLAAFGPLPVIAWRIQTKAYREDLRWAVTLASSTPPSAAVRTLLTELAARGVTIHQETQPWEGAPCD